MKRRSRAFTTVLPSLLATLALGLGLPLLQTKAKGQRGQTVQVWTSDDMVFTYTISEVFRHVPYDEGLDRPAAATAEELWLQTSEGPRPPLSTGTCTASGPSRP